MTQDSHFVRITYGFRPEGPYCNLMINEARTGGQQIVIPLDTAKLVGLLRDGASGLTYLVR